MDIKDQLEGFNLKWIAANIVHPDNKIGVSYNTFYGWITDDRKMPNWLIPAIERLTNRKIKQS